MVLILPGLDAEAFFVDLGKVMESERFAFEKDMLGSEQELFPATR